MALKRFVSGGTVQASNGIYIPRKADEDLYQACMDGEYATVLTARQRGKSSLMVNTTQRLRKAGLHVATLDISPFGHQSNPEDWYSTILEIIASPSNLDIDMDVIDWWEQQAASYPMTARRFQLFFETVVLKQKEGHIVIFVDEIDKTFDLPFTDDFFVGVRALFNQRSQDAEFQRISFVLLGVASPTELIKSKTSTPYNIGQQVELADFSLDELMPLQKALEEQTPMKADAARFITNAIYYWTSGHPYLTQKLFKEVSTAHKADKQWDQRTIDAMVTTLFLKPRTTPDSNIIEVKSRLEFERLHQAEAVDLFAKILIAPTVRDEQEAFAPKTFLKLSGAITVQDGYLEIRNRIYEAVVGYDWFEETYQQYYNKPADDLFSQFRQNNQQFVDFSNVPFDSASPFDTTEQQPQDEDELSAWVEKIDLTRLPPNPFEDEDKSDETGPFQAQVASDNDQPQASPLPHRPIPFASFDDNDDPFGASTSDSAGSDADLFFDDDEFSFGESSFDDFDDDVDFGFSEDPVPKPESPSLLQRASGLFRRARNTPEEHSTTHDSDTKSEAQETNRSSLNPPPAAQRPAFSSRMPPRPSTNATDSYVSLKDRIQKKLLAELSPDIDFSDKDKIRQHVQDLFNNILAEENMLLSRAERNRLFEAIVADIFGFGPLEALLADDTITEIMVNGPKMVYIEQRGRLTLSTVTFDNDEHILRVIDRIVAPLGRRVDESSPIVHARLPDGSRVSVTVRPIALNGPTLTIRRFSRTPLTIQDLIRFGSMTPEIAEFLRACVIASVDMLVVGGIGSGKTALLNVLSSFIPNDERVITVERTAELQLQHEHVITLEARPPNIEGRGEVTLRDLSAQALSLRPDRMVFGQLEMDDIEALLLTSGRVNGLMATLAADSLDSAMSTIEISLARANQGLSLEHIRAWVGNSIKLIVEQQRMRDGSRRVTTIAEVVKLGPGRYGLETIFKFEQTGIEAGKIIGRVQPTGIRPSFMPQIEGAGIFIPPSVFGVGRRR